MATAWKVWNGNASAIHRPSLGPVVPCRWLAASASPSTDSSIPSILPSPPANKLCNVKLKSRQSGGMEPNDPHVNVGTDARNRDYVRTKVKKGKWWKVLGLPDLCRSRGCCWTGICCHRRLCTDCWTRGRGAGPLAGRGKQLRRLRTQWLRSLPLPSSTTFPGCSSRP